MSTSRRGTSTTMSRSRTSFTIRRRSQEDKDGIRTPRSRTPDKATRQVLTLRRRTVVRKEDRRTQVRRVMIPTTRNSPAPGIK